MSNFFPFARLGWAAFYVLIIGLCFLSPCFRASAQSIPGERRIRYREKSLTPYDPYSAEKLWKRIKIPPAPALSPEEAIKSFKLAPGFRIELVAAEPLVVDPIMFEFDPDGRIWAVEFRGWMLDIDGSGEGDPIGKVVVLEDTDGDTVMDRSTVFLDKLVMPRTVSFVEGGVLIAEPPNLWYCRDTDGDLKCDSKKLVGNYGRPGNPEHTDNGLMHGIDNWMHSADSGSRHRFRNGELIVQKAFHRGQWGMTQDDYGRLFYNYENRPLHADLMPADYAFRNENLDVDHSTRSMPIPGLNESVLPRSGEVYPIRVTPGITLGGTELREDGTLRTFTIACGPSIYRGNQFPKEHYGSAVIPEAAGNLVRLAPISSDGVELAATNAFEKRELLASTDERFRPVCSRTAPDGALYFCDLYRGIIEHVIFMMPYLRNQILSRGLDKPIGMGRIYRIVHEDKPLGKPPQMSRQSSAELAEHLSHPNGWWRDTAQRLLVERQSENVATPLRQMARTNESHLGRLHALWTLDGKGQLDWNTTRNALNDKHEMVRATAIRLSERFLETPNRPEVVAGLKSVYGDARPMVRFQLLLTLGEIGDADAQRLMAAIVNEHPTRYFGTAALSGLQGQELEFLARLLAGSDFSAEKEKAIGLIKTLAMAVMNEQKPDRVSRLLELAIENPGDPTSRSAAVLAGALACRQSRSHWPTTIHLAERPGLLHQLEKSPESQGLASRLLRLVTWPGDTTERAKRPVLKPLTETQNKQFVLGESVYHATCHSCHKQNGQGQVNQAPPLVGSEWVNGDPTTLARIVLHGLGGPIQVRGGDWDLLMPGLGHSPFLNDDRLAAVLTYVRRAWGNTGDPVDSHFVASVRRAHLDRTDMWTVESLQNPEAELATNAQKSQDPMIKYRPAVSGGNAKRGEGLFHAATRIRCHACHQVAHMGGGFVGPNLTEIGDRSTREYLLESLIDPSAIIAEGYKTLGIATRDGELHSGILISDDDNGVTLGLPLGGTLTIVNDDVEHRITSTVSSMPPVGDIYSVEEIADLIAYLAGLKKSNQAKINSSKIQKNRR